MISHQTIVAPSAPIVRRYRQDRRFYIGVGIAMLVLNVAAFAPALLMPSTRTVPLPLTPAVALHAAVSLAWLLLFLAQTALVASHRTALHRRLGVAGVVLAAAFVIIGWVSALEQARRGFDLSGDLVPRGTSADPATNLVPLNAFVLFALLVGLAIWFRTRPEVHKRLMVFAMIGPVAGAPLAHLMGHWPVVAPVVAGIHVLLLLALCPIHDRISLGKVHPTSWWGALGVFVWGVAFFGFVPTTEAWHDFATWLAR